MGDEWQGQGAGLFLNPSQVGQLREPRLDQIVGGETDAHGDGSLDPVHAKSLVEAVLDALLAVWKSQ